LTYFLNTIIKNVKSISSWYNYIVAN